MCFEQLSIVGTEKQATVVICGCVGTTRVRYLGKEIASMVELEARVGS